MRLQELWKLWRLSTISKRACQYNYSFNDFNLHSNLNFNSYFHLHSTRSPNRLRKLRRQDSLFNFKEYYTNISHSVWLIRQLLGWRYKQATRPLKNSEEAEGRYCVSCQGFSDSDEENVVMINKLLTKSLLLLQKLMLETLRSSC